MIDTTLRVRKYLILDFAPAQILENARSTAIIQNYLMSREPGELFLRWTIPLEGEDTFYSISPYRTQPSRRRGDVPHGVITREQYVELLATRRDRRLKPIERTRYDFDYRGKHYRVHSYHEHLKGLDILELKHEGELNEKELPADWQVIELGDYSQYTSLALASRTHW
ncbi:MAG: hypothetical protein JWN18_330 [Parcubacteria group bacterium]|nr:hypothetical protein [Parcubacteria group bacterium]